MRSTPVATSSARMLRPSRPMIRPFMSSLGRSTTVTVVSMVWSAALRWIACVTMPRARSAACSRASASMRLARVAASPLARDERIGLRRALRGRVLARGDGVLAAAERLVSLVERLRLLEQRRLALHEQLLHPRDLLAMVARELLGLDAQLVRALAGLDERFLAPGVRVPLGVAHDPRGLLFGLADRLGGDALAVGNPPRHRRGRGREGDEEVEDVFEGLGGHKP